MDNIQIRVEGSQADPIATSLKQFLTEQLAIEAQVVSPSNQTDTATRKVDAGIALGIVSILIGLPSFFESKTVSSLTRRIKAKEKLNALVDWSLVNLPKDSDTTIWLEINGETVLLNAENLTEMLNALEPSD